MKDRIRNRHKSFPAPKAVISTPVFLQAIAKRRRAENIAGVVGVADWVNQNREAVYIEVVGAASTGNELQDKSRGHTENGDAQPMEEEKEVKP